MEVSRLLPVFHVVSWLHVVLAHVEPPTNITLECQNLNNVLQWSYKQPKPDLRFRVDIGSTLGLNGHPNKIWVDPPDLQANVSFLSDPNNEYFLQVTAVIGQNASETVPQEGIFFSYFKDSLVDRKCSVDLPRVDVTAQPDANILLRFDHPWLLYRDKIQSSPNSKQHHKKRHRSMLPEFTYTVEIINQREHDFICEESVCEQKLAVDPAQEHCLKISGELKKMLVKGTQLYCTDPAIVPPHEKNYIYLVVGLLAVAVAVAVALVLMVYRSCQNPSVTLPWSISQLGAESSHLSGTPEDVIIVPEVDPTTPTPLLPPETEETPVMTSDYDFRLPIRGIAGDENECYTMDAEQQDNEESEYMGGREMEEESEATSGASGYEKREVLVDLGPDDRAEGYRG